MQKKDWFTELKIEVISHNIRFMHLRESMIILLETNRWILEDINLCESFCNLQKMVEISYQEFTELVEEIEGLDNNASVFQMNDLIDQFDYIIENIYLEFAYMINMIDYMKIIRNPYINGNEITVRCNQYDQNDHMYLNQMKLNNDGLKKLKKERRDSFE